MDKKKHEFTVIRLQMNLQEDIRMLYYLGRKNDLGDADEGIELDHELSLKFQDDTIKAVCEQFNNDGVTARVCAVTTDHEDIETVVELDQLSIEDLNELYIELCDMTKGME